MPLRYLEHIRGGDSQAGLEHRAAFLSSLRFTKPPLHPEHLGERCWQLGKFEHLRLSPLWDGMSDPRPHAGHCGLNPSLTCTSGEFLTNSLTNGDGRTVSVIRYTAFLALVRAT